MIELSTTVLICLLVFFIMNTAVQAYSVAIYYKQLLLRLYTTTCSTRLTKAYLYLKMALKSTFCTGTCTVSPPYLQTVSTLLTDTHQPAYRHSPLCLQTLSTLFTDTLHPALTDMMLDL